MLALQGVGVLVTRPEQQAGALCHRLELVGAYAARLPAISIQGCDDVSATATRTAAIGDFDLIIFTSANAVRYGAKLLEGAPDAPLAAIGPATARALAALGKHVRVAPSGRFDSEGLLADPSLTHPAGRRILLVKGMNGRELLQDELTRRGARIVVAEVYRRVPARPTAAAQTAIAADIAAGTIHIVTATSVEIIASLLDMTELRPSLECLHWLVPGARVAAALRDRGVMAGIVQAAAAEDQDLVEALVRWRSSASGA